MGKGTPKKQSLTNMDFGAHRNNESSSSRKQSSFRMASIHEAFKKVLAAIVSIKDSRPRLFSKRNSDMLKMEDAAAFSSRGKGTANPMASTPRQSKAKKRFVAPPSPIFGAYNPNGGGISVPIQQKKKNPKKGSDKDKNDKSDVLEIEEESDFVSDNPRYLARKRKEEKQKRLAAGEKLEDINADFAKRKAKKKKNVMRSPLPPGV